MPTHTCTRTSRMRRAFALLLPLALLFGVISADQMASAGGSRHPYFNDRGTLTWYRSLADAERAARREGKLIFVEYGRSQCSNCRRLAERILPHEQIRGRIHSIAVGLATDCDRPEWPVEKIFRRHLPSARMLPFAAFLTPDGQWVTGWSGYRRLSQVSQSLSIAESRHTALMRASTPHARTPASTHPTPERQPTPQPAAHPVRQPAPRPAPQARREAPQAKTATPAHCDGKSTKDDAEDLEAEEPACEGGECCAGGSCKAPSFPQLPNPFKLFAGKCPPKCPPKQTPPRPCPTPPAPVTEEKPAVAAHADFPPPAPRVEVPTRKLARAEPASTATGSPDGAAKEFPAPATPDRLPAPTVRRPADAPTPTTPRTAAVPADIGTARAAAARGDWASVLAYTRNGSRNDADVQGLERQAHQWAHGRLAYAVRAVRDGRYVDARAAVEDVSVTMRGEPEAVDAERGLEAIELMRDLVPLAEKSLVRRTVRKTAYEKMRGTRWAPLFSPVPQPTAAVAQR